MINLALLGTRLLTGALLVGAALQKTISPGDAGGLQVGAGLPFMLVWPALFYNALAGLALWRCVLSPYLRRPIARSPVSLT